MRFKVTGRHLIVKIPNAEQQIAVWFDAETNHQ